MPSVAFHWCSAWVGTSKPEINLNIKKCLELSGIILKQTLVSIRCCRRSKNKPVVVVFLYLLKAARIFIVQVLG